MGKIINLYHGSIYKFDTIDVSKGKPFKDFGIGFYLSPSKKHSLSLAQRNKQLELIRLNKRKKKPSVNAWIYQYEFDSEYLHSFNTKNFPQVNAEWMKFVAANRNSKRQRHNFDIVIGPTANDTTRASIQAFFAGVYGDINDNRTINILIGMLETNKLPVQYYFGSQSAADLLVFKDRIIVE
ncbi:MAG: DUF3990 domain-containing protein [Treponema sp.]|nr:DUF3990 domain-containing protein [Treponema sp.]